MGRPKAVYVVLLSEPKEVGCWLVPGRMMYPARDVAYVTGEVMVRAPVTVMPVIVLTLPELDWAPTREPGRKASSTGKFGEAKAPFKLMRRMEYVAGGTVAG
jgi:hypothetical protein